MSAVTPSASCRVLFPPLYRRHVMTLSFLKRLMWSAIAVAVLNGSVRAASLDAQAINEAQWTGEKVQPGTVSPRTVKLQILLDRAHFSPGEIDGQPGENIDKAIAAYAASQGSEQLTSELWRNLTEAASSSVIVEHKLTEVDVKGPFIEKMPLKMEAMKGPKALAYVSPKEKIAEQFHISPALLAALNPGQHFDRPGDTNSRAEYLKRKAGGKGGSN